MNSQTTSSRTSRSQADSAKKTRGLIPFHHLLLATFPVIGVYANNAGAVPAREVLLLLAAFQAFALLLWFVLARFMGWKRAALGVSWTLICLLLFSYGAVQSASERLGGGPGLWRVLMVVWLGATLGGIAWIAGARRDVQKMTGMLTIFSLVLFASPTLMVAHAWLTGSNWRSSGLGHSSEFSQLALAADSPKRDVYYLVFDRYADERTLKYDFGFDNRPFLDSLRRRGFYVAEHSRANYCKTDVSMSSALNMAYHDESMEFKQHYAEMLRAHAVGQLFKQQGYRYYHYGNLLDGIRHSAIADYNYRFSAMPTEFSESVLRTTALCHFFPPKDVRLQEHEKFVLLTKNIGESSPKFVYAHFLLPHGPWKFDRDGTPLTPQLVGQRTQQESYIRQLEYTNTRILAAVDAILRQSATPPIIVLQADEGPELKYENDGEKDRPRRMRKRLGILSAFYLPERDAASVVPDDITPVNTFRLIFHEYFAADLPLLANRSYYWDPDPENVYGKPEIEQQRRRKYRMVNVTDQVHGCFPGSS